MNEELLSKLFEAAAVTIVTGVIAWFGEKRLGWIAAWRQRRQQKRNTKLAIESMAASHPTLLAGIQELTTNVSGMKATLKQQDRDLADIKAMQWGSMELDTTPRFVCDNEGKNRLVNTAYARLLRIGRGELDQYGYKNFIDSESAKTYLPKFDQAAREHRQMDAVIRMVRPDGSKFWVEVRLIPYPEGMPPATHWLGTLTYIREDEQT